MQENVNEVQKLQAKITLPTSDGTSHNGQQYSNITQPMSDGNTNSADFENQFNAMKAALSKLNKQNLFIASRISNR